MSHGRHYSQHQKGIIRRYYENKEHLMAQKLGEIVSDLSVCEDSRRAGRLWNSARTALLNAGAHPERASRICDERDLEALAALVGEIF